jgi:arylamine N-acetyltransferase
MLRLRRNDPVLSARARWEDLEATAHGNVLEVVRRSGRSTRRLLVSFDAGDTIVPVGAGARVLFASSRFEAGRLGAHAAVVLADD